MLYIFQQLVRFCMINWSYQIWLDWLRVMRKS